MVNNIRAGETFTQSIILDEFGESLNVAGTLTTGPDIAVTTQAILNGIDVESTGEISSESTAVQVDGEASVINNEGSITGGFNAINIANNDSSSARVLNQGIISSDSRAVNIGGLGGVVINEGHILSTADPRNGTVYGDVTAQNIRIENRESGVIDVGAGNNGDAVSLELGPQVSGVIINEGLIQGRGLPGIVNPENQASALRFYSPSGPARFTGRVENSGTLAAENGPAVVIEDNVTFKGRIHNSGLIISDNPVTGVGFRIEDGGRLAGRLINSGTINGGFTGVDFANGGTSRGTVVNQRDGVITSASRAVNIGGDRNRLINRGLITTSADPRNGTVYADQSANNFRIINHATGVIDVGEGLNGDAIALQLGSDVTGSIVNRGTVLGRGVPDGSQNNATNQATAIRLYHGDQAGPVSIFNGNIQNLGSGLLNSENDHAILIESQVQFNGNIVNTGIISSNDEDAIRTEGEFNGNIINRGTIIGDNDGLQISQTFNGNINNFGNIAGVTGEGIDLRDTSGDFTFTGDINNRGTITGDSGGVRIDDDVVLDGSINNRGTILSEDEGDDAVDILGSITGVLNNRGLIQAPGFAIDAQSANDGLTVNNSGVIVGDVRLSDFDDVFDGSDGITQGEVLGLDGNDQLIGGRLSDTLVGGIGNDTLTGGAGQDEFVFTPSDVGADVITDFQDGLDLLNVDAFNFGVADVQALIAGAQQIGNDVLVSFNTDNTVLLQSFQLNQLDVNDFS